MYNPQAYSPAIVVRDPTRVVNYTYLGLDEMGDYYERANNKDYADFLKDKGILSESECERLKEMIDSPDRENLEIAKGILDEKAKLIKQDTKWQSFLKSIITFMKA